MTAAVVDRRRQRQPGRPRDPGRYPAAAVPRARRTDVVHGPGARPARFRRLLQRGGPAGLATGRLGVSPATYLLRGIRDALLNGASLTHQAGLIGILALFGVVLVPVSLFVFGLAERWAKKTGRLKRQG